MEAQNQIQIVTAPLDAIESALDRAVQRGIEIGRKSAEEKRDTILNITESAKYLKVSIPTLRRKVKQFGLRKVSGAKKGYYQSDLDRLKYG